MHHSWPLSQLKNKIKKVKSVEFWEAPNDYSEKVHGTAESDLRMLRLNTTKSEGMMPPSNLTACDSYLEFLLHRKRKIPTNNYFYLITYGAALPLMVVTII